MDHMRLSDDLRNMLMEAAAWGKAGINPTIESEMLEEASAEEEEVEVEEEEEEEDEEEELEEGALHVCPLCVSPLEEALDEESLLEHLNVVVTLIDRLTQINEGEEDVEDVIHNTVADLLLGEDED
jgi:DNA repair exonuclease SbcCD ATPase subunit